MGIPFPPAMPYQECAAARAVAEAAPDANEITMSDVEEALNADPTIETVEAQPSTTAAVDTGIA